MNPADVIQDFGKFEKYSPAGQGGTLQPGQSIQRGGVTIRRVQ
jgi:hypothetical protein